MPDFGRGSSIPPVPAPAAMKKRNFPFTLEASSVAGSLAPSVPSTKDTVFGTLLFSRPGPFNGVIVSEWSSSVGSVSVKKVWSPALGVMFSLIGKSAVFNLVKASIITFLVPSSVPSHGFSASALPGFAGAANGPMS